MRRPTRPLLTAVTVVVTLGLAGAVTVGCRPDLIGWHAVDVTDAAMDPRLPAGSRAYGAPLSATAPTGPHVGDIVVVTDQPGAVVRRVVDVPADRGGQVVVVAAEAPGRLPATVARQQVTAEVAFYVPWIGGAASAVTAQPWTWGALAVGALVFALTLWNLLHAATVVAPTRHKTRGRERPEAVPAGSIAPPNTPTADPAATPTPDAPTDLPTATHTLSVTAAAPSPAAPSRHRGYDLDALPGLRVRDRDAQPVWALPPVDEGALPEWDGTLDEVLLRDRALIPAGRQAQAPLRAVTPWPAGSHARASTPQHRWTREPPQEMLPPMASSVFELPSIEILGARPASSRRAHSAPAVSGADHSPPATTGAPRSAADDDVDRGAQGQTAYLSRRERREAEAAGRRRRWWW